MESFGHSPFAHQANPAVPCHVLPRAGTPPGVPRTYLRFIGISYYIISATTHTSNAEYLSLHHPSVVLRGGATTSNVPAWLLNVRPPWPDCSAATSKTQTAASSSIATWPLPQRMATTQSRGERILKCSRRKSFSGMVLHIYLILELLFPLMSIL